MKRQQMHKAYRTTIKQDELLDSSPETITLNALLSCCGNWARVTVGVGRSVIVLLEVAVGTRSSVDDSGSDLLSETSEADEV